MKASYDADTDMWLCNLCERKTERASADHIIPVGLATDWNSFIEMMFFGELQCLCKPCHKSKSKDDNKRIRELRNGITKSKSRKAGSSST
jgi:5-methylcytosine-specific restriction endonuclease McrA